MKKYSKHEEPTLFLHAIVFGIVGLWIANSFEGGLNGGQGFLLLFALGIGIPVMIVFIMQWIRIQVVSDVLDTLEKEKVNEHKADKGLKS